MPEINDIDMDFFDFELPNVGVGDDPLSLTELTEEDDVDFVVILFQRDYYCGNCRKQVQKVAERYDEFEERNAVVVSILPEPVEKAKKWQEKYDLPYPFLADESKKIGDEYGQPNRFGFLGNLVDLVGRMPETVIIDTREENEIVYVHKGKSTYDRPSIDDILEEIDDILEES